MDDLESVLSDKVVVLVGLMGAGKTRIGRRLAARLGLEFVDADSEIEAAAGCSIPDIFAAHGEAAFREGERRVIARLLDRKGIVLATGGGAFIDRQTRRLIDNKAISLWLRADLDLLHKRVSRRDNRPLLRGGDRREILSGLIEERYPVYAEADIVVDSRDEPHDAMVRRIVARLAEHLGASPAAKLTAKDKAAPGKACPTSPG
jgi:shikimate kinase